MLEEIFDLLAKYGLWVIAGIFSLYIGREVLVYAIDRREERQKQVYWERKGEEEKVRQAQANAKRLSDMIEEQRLKSEQVLRDIIKIPSIDESDLGFDVSDLVRNDATLQVQKTESTEPLDDKGNTLEVHSPINEVKPIIEPSKDIRWKLEDEVKHEIARPEPIKEIIEEKPKYDVRYDPIKNIEYTERGYDDQIDFINYLISQNYEIIEHNERERTLPDIVAFKNGVFYVYSFKSWKCDNQRIKAGCNARTLYRKDIWPEIKEVKQLINEGHKAKLMLAFYNPLNHYCEIEEITNIDNWHCYTTSSRFGSIN